VTAEKIVEGWAGRTGVACVGRHVLAIQDTCEVKVPTTAQRRRRLGPVKKSPPPRKRGAEYARSGSCLGLVDGDVWSRNQVNPTPHRHRPLTEHESVRWVNPRTPGEAGAGVCRHGDGWSLTMRRISTLRGAPCRKRTSMC
jgi:hypothetical protein